MQKILLQHKIPDSERSGIIIDDMFFMECKRMLKLLDLQHKISEIVTLIK